MERLLELLSFAYDKRPLLLSHDLLDMGRAASKGQFFDRKNTKNGTLR